MGTGDDTGDRGGNGRRGAELRARTSELRSTTAAKGSELGRTAAQRAADIRRSIRTMDVPWARCRAARMTREMLLQGGLAPLMRLYMRLQVSGRERFDHLPAPVVLAANHSSHLDTPIVLRALPLRWRQRTAVAAAADYFYKKRLVAGAVSLMFNTVPILRGGGGASAAFEHVDRLIDGRWNLLMFPEGTRSREGHLGPLRPGAAIIARNHQIPIVPVQVRGTREAMPPGQGWPRRRAGFFSRRHRIEVRFGPPIYVLPGDDVAQAMLRVRAFFEHGAHDGGAADLATAADELGLMATPPLGRITGTPPTAGAEASPPARDGRPEAAAASPDSPS